MDLRTSVSLLRRCLGLVVLGAVLGAGVAAFVTSRMTDEYESRTRVIASSAQADLGAAYTGALLSIERVRGYVVLVESRLLAERVRDDLGLEDDVSSLIDAVQASVVDETAVLELVVVDEDPSRAQAIAQAYAEELVRLTRAIETPEDGSAPVRLTVIDDATVSDDPVSPRPVLNLALGIVLGTLVGLALGLARALLSTRITDVDELQAATSVVVLATIDREPGRRNRLVSDLAPHDPRTESFRLLRTNLQFVDVDKAHKVFAVTSALPGDGKTSTVVNLAVSMTRAGLRVLLVDADLRRPNVAEVLGLDSATGLTSILVGRAAFAEIVQQHEPSGLSVLASGPTPPNAAELFQTKAMAALVDEMRSSYDLVLFDTAPLLPVADTAVLGALTDGALIVARHRKTTLEQVTTSIDRLDRTGVAVVGLVLNQFSSGRRSGRYAAYYTSGRGSRFALRRSGRRTPKPGRRSRALDDHRS